MEAGKIKRNCTACARELNIILKKNKKYSGGNYFGRLKIPAGKRRHVKLEAINLINEEFDVVEWKGNEKEVEYWECSKCFSILKQGKSQ